MLRASRSAPMSVAVSALGCKVSAADARSLLRDLSADPAEVRLVDTDVPADVYVLFTCTVTAAADRDTRKLVHRLRRRAPEALIVLTGCLASAQPAEAAAIHGVDHVLAPADLAGLPALVRERRERGPGPTAAGPEESAAAPRLAPGSEPRGPLVPPLRRGGDRPYLKVQDGCDAGCAYCILPAARGGLRSVPAERVERELAALEDLGALEVVVTGINLARWGRDLDAVGALPSLLRTLLGAGRRRARIRLSSLEPEGLDEELLSVLADSPHVCRHLHIPLQSGDDGVLAAMGRPYTVAAYRRAIEHARSRLPGLTLGSDLLVGFPGESESAHRRTVATVEALGLDYLHVFAFSPRPGTRAASMDSPVPLETKRARSAELRALGQRRRALWHQRWIGQTVEVLVESRPDRGSGLLGGYGREYQRVLLQPGGGPCAPGQRCYARVLRDDGRRLVGQALPYLTDERTTQ